MAPAIIALLGTDGALVVTGLFLALTASLLWLPLRRHEPDGRAADADFRLLRGDSIFAPLSIATIEGLAMQLERRASRTRRDDRRPGRAWRRVLPRRGGRRRGARRRERRHIGSGGSFGEIALLRDLPRTATVRALEPTDLRTLSRERFLLAVTGEPDSRDTAHELADRLLGGWVQDEGARAAQPASALDEAQAQAP